MDVAIVVVGVAALVVVGLLVVSFLVGRITAKGGTSDNDATAIANQVLAETDAFLGSRSANDQSGTARSDWPNRLRTGGSSGPGWSHRPDAMTREATPPDRRLDGGSRPKTDPGRRSVD